MRYLALACDYDGTLAAHGSVDTQTLEALRQLKATGRKILLVTGRELEDLLRIFPHVDLFERVVAENGALLYRPKTNEAIPLSDPPPNALVERLRERGVSPLSVGRVIIATQEPNESIVLQSIRELGLELQIIFNKGAVMVLPSNVNKASGLAAALQELNLSPHNVVGVGDAENDHAFLEYCECAIAVQNALPALKARADLVTTADHGAGVAELIDLIIREDLRTVHDRLRRHDILLGVRQDDQELRLPAACVSVLLAGTSGGGKSTFVMSFLERLLDRRYQACIVDPEGDYSDVEKALVLGDDKRTPTVDEITKALENPAENIIVNLIGLRLEDRPPFFQKLLPSLFELRARTGRPHWIIIDEVHHVLPSTRDPSPLIVPTEFKGVLSVTVNPSHVTRSLLSAVDFVVAIGNSPNETIDEFCQSAGTPAPRVHPVTLEPGEALGWWRDSRDEPFWFRSIPPKTLRRRHARKYMQGELPPKQSFYFEGPQGKLSLRAQNLQTFLQLAEGVDDQTWMFHLRRGDYSRWFRTYIKDEALAEATENIERAENISPEESRTLIRTKIEEQYTAPA